MFKRCVCCNRRDIVETRKYSHLAGETKVHYCSKCYNELLKQELERQQINKANYEREQKEKQRNNYYNKLKREVEISELEEKAKLLGLDITE